MNKSTTRLIAAIAKCFMLFMGLVSVVSCTSKPPQTEAYLFAYFIGNGPGEEAIRYAVSTDGYNYRALNNNQPILDSKKISTSGGVRDPHILRGRITSYNVCYTKLLRVRNSCFMEAYLQVY